MSDITIPSTPCPHCGSEMYPDYDVTNDVRVFVCSKPTCLHRIYPDYPPRKGNQEICYLCGDMFTVHDDCPGVLCPACKDVMQKAKQKERRDRKRTRRTFRPAESRMTV